MKVLWMTGALVAALALASPARAGDEFEDAFKYELGRIAAHEAVGLGRGILAQLILGGPGGHGHHHAYPGPRYRYPDPYYGDYRGRGYGYGYGDDHRYRKHKRRHHHHHHHHRHRYYDECDD